MFPFYRVSSLKLLRRGLAEIQLTKRKDNLPKAKGVELAGKDE